MDTNAEGSASRMAGNTVDNADTVANAAVLEVAEIEGHQNENMESIKPEANGLDVANGAGFTASDAEIKPEPAQEIKEEETEMPIVPTDVEITDTLLGYLKEDTFTMDITERQLRSRLEKHFGLPLKDKKSIIRDKVWTSSVQIVSQAYIEAQFTCSFTQGKRSLTFPTGITSLTLTRILHGIT